MSELGQRIRATGKQYVTVSDFIKAGIGQEQELAYPTVYLRISKLRGADSPDAFGALRVGRTIAFTLDSGVAYAEHLERLWSKKEPS